MLAMRAQVLSRVAQSCNQPGRKKLRFFRQVIFTLGFVDQRSHKERHYDKEQVV